VRPVKKDVPNIPRVSSEGRKSQVKGQLVNPVFLLTKTKLVVNEPNSNSLTKTKTKLKWKSETKLKRKMCNEFIIVLGNYQQIAVTKCKVGTGVTLCY